MTNYTVGAQMYSVRDRTQDETAMRKCFQELKAAGFSSVQMSGYNMKIPAERVAAMLAETGLTCDATHVSFDWMEEDIAAVIRHHEALNCRYPGVGSMPDKYRGSAEGFREFARRASAVAEKLADAGQRFIYHNHAFELTRFPEGRGLDILFDEFSPAVQFEIDTFWIQAGGMNPIEWIKKVAGRMDVVHFKDMKPTATIAEIGAGNLDWPAIMAACDEIHVKYAFIEQDNAVETDSVACLTQSLNYLKPLGARF